MIVDANVLLGAMLGSSIWRLERLSSEGVLLLSPFHQFAETRAVLHLKLGAAASLVASKMDRLAEVVGELDPDMYLPFEQDARARIENPRSRDWPVLAAAMALDDDILSNDRDFFGVGVPIWSTWTVDHRKARPHG